jgi:hypothetical protein
VDLEVGNDADYEVAGVERGGLTEKPTVRMCDRIRQVYTGITYGFTPGIEVVSQLGCIQI